MKRTFEKKKKKKVKRNAEGKEKSTNTMPVELFLKKRKNPWLRFDSPRDSSWGDHRQGNFRNSDTLRLLAHFFLVFNWIGIR